MGARSAIQPERSSRRAVGGDADRRPALAVRHLRFGWWSLLLFLTLGIGLEALHGFKTGWYLDVSASTRRLMWTLAHAHGTLLSLVNLGFAATLRGFPMVDEDSASLASPLLLAATVLLPGGFLLGGVDPRGGDPGLGIAAVALGGLLLLLGVFLIARSCTKKERSS